MAVFAALICSNRLVCDVESKLVIQRASHPDSVCSVYVCVCGCVCVCCFDSWFVFGCCHCSPFLLVSSSSGPPFFSLCCQFLHLPFLSLLEKDYGSCALTSTHSLPEPCKSLASCPWSLHFKLLSPSSLSLQLFYWALFLPLCPGDCVE